MRIAQVSTLSSPVCENAGGSVEAWLWLLTRELTRLGHEVTVFGAAGSQTHGELVATLPGPYGAKDSLEDWQLCEWVNLCRAVEQSERFDVLHTHAYLWGLPLEPLSRAPIAPRGFARCDQSQSRRGSKVKPGRTGSPETDCGSSRQISRSGATWSSGASAQNAVAAGKGETNETTVANTIAIRMYYSDGRVDSHTALGVSPPGIATRVEPARVPERFSSFHS